MNKPERLVSPGFMQQCQDLIDRLVASEDSNEKAMLWEQLKALIMPKRER